MAASTDSQERLPAMIPSEEVAENRRLQDLKVFRRYLADAGVVRCLVQLYQHTSKHELRMDNPAVVRDFLASYQSDHPDARESARLIRENATLREYNTIMEGQIDELTLEVKKRLRFRTGRKLWRTFISVEFWKGIPGEQRPSGEGEMTLRQIFCRLCGSRVDQRTGQILVDLLRPPALVSTVTVLMDDFFLWVAEGMADAVQSWTHDVLLPMLVSEPMCREPPFEKDILQQIHESGLYPEHIEEVANFVDLNVGLKSFLDALAERFRRL